MFYTSYISNNRKGEKKSSHKKNRLELIVENSAKNFWGFFVCLLVYFLEIVYKKQQNKSKTKKNKK